MSGAVLSAGLVYETRMAVGWRVLPSPLDADYTARLNDSNELFLRSLNTLEEVPCGRFEVGETGGDLQPELERLDIKPNLLMELVGHVLSRQLGMPPRADVRLGRAGMAWRGPRQPPQCGTDLVVDLYVQPRYPRPLELPGRTTAVRDGWVELEFLGLNEAVEEGLQRLIFRHHRRDVATRRRPASRSRDHIPGHAPCQDH